MAMMRNDFATTAGAKYLMYLPTVVFICIYSDRVLLRRKLLSSVYWAMRYSYTPPESIGVAITVTRT